MSHASEHDHPWFLAHHWEDPKQQFEAGKLGMWLFLATEVLLFGGLFCAYWVIRVNNPDLFRMGAEYLNTWMGATNTVVLILSSLTMAWGVTAAMQGKQRTLKIMLALTLAGAAGFLVIKYFEYQHKLHEGWKPAAWHYALPEHAEGFVIGEPVTGLPSAAAPSTAAQALPPEGSAVPLELGAERSTVPVPVEGPTGFALEGEAEALDLARYTPEGALRHPAQRAGRPENPHMFFNIYYMMTGLHAIHVIVGMIVITWLLWKSFRGQFGPEYFTPVDLGGLYWHVVDLIWIFLFPMFYLI